MTNPTESTPPAMGRDEHEAKVKASYLSYSDHGLYFHDCCGALRIVAYTGTWAPDSSDQRIIRYLTRDQALQLRDKINEWYPHV